MPVENTAPNANRPGAARPARVAPLPGHAVRQPIPASGPGLGAAAEIRVAQPAAPAHPHGILVRAPRAAQARHVQFADAPPPNPWRRIVCTMVVAVLAVGVAATLLSLLAPRQD